MRRVWLTSLVLFLVTFAVFSRVLVAGFVSWDDNISVYENPHIQGLDWARLQWMFSDASYAMRYKPLTWLAYALIYQAEGLKPFGYHLANLLLHCFNTVLVFLVIRQLLAAAGSRGAFNQVSVGPEESGPDGLHPCEAEKARLKQATLPAAVGALLWALNPLRVEPVARVTDLTFCLQLFFLLLSLRCYLRAVCGAGGESRFAPWYWCSVAAFGLAMLAYPFALGYGIVLLVLDWYPLARFQVQGRESKVQSPELGISSLESRVLSQEPDSPVTHHAPRTTHHVSHFTFHASRLTFHAPLVSLLLEKVPFLLLGATMLPTLFARLNPAGLWVSFRVDTHFSLFGRVMQAFYVWAYYVWKPWWPFHLSPLYTTLVNFNPNTWPFWLSAALVIGATVWLALRRNRWPWALALWISYLVLLVPVLGLTEHPHYTADRYDYLPGLVWAVAIAALLRVAQVSKAAACPPALRAWKPALPEVGLVLALGLAVFWGALSLHQTRVWRNSVVLFKYMITQLKDDPYRSDIQWRLGAVLAGEGKTQQAVQQYEASLRVHPSPEAHFALAQLLQRTGDGHGALTNCLAALALDLTPLNRVQAGQVLASLGHGAEAIKQYRLALASAPKLVPALNNLAWILATDPNPTNRNGTEAVQLAERACALTGYQTPVLVGTLAAAYAEAGQFKEAIATAQRALNLAQAARKPDVAERNRQLLALYQSGRAYHQPPPAGGP